MTFDQYVGMEFDDGDGEFRTARLRILPHHCNPTGNVNGGVFLALADNLATGTAARAHQRKTGESAFMVGIDVHAVILSNQKGGEIRAEASVVRVGRRVAVIRTVITGEAGKALAEVTTTHIPA